MAKLINELNGYQIIPRELIFDNALSDRARFVYVFMASKPDNWEFFLEPMSNEIGYSMDTLRKYIKELVESGWLVKGQQENDNGKFGAVEYIIKAKKELSSTKTSDTEKTRHGKNPAQYNIDDKHKKENINNKKTNDKKQSDVDLFEQCWIAYNRKGSKKKSKEYWEKLNDKERSSVLTHIKAYVSCRDRQYQKDFERYLRDKTFRDVVSKGNDIIYDPSRFESGIYTPQGRTIWFNDETQSYWSNDNFYYGTIDDGYDDDNRPDGAEITLNNARGTYKWNTNAKQWIKTR